MLERERQAFDEKIKELSDRCARYHRSISSPSSPDDIDNSTAKDDSKDLINRLQTERDYYSSEYHRLKENLSEHPSQQDNETSELRRRLIEKERELADSKQTIREMGREKHNLQVRRDSAQERSSGSSSPLECVGGISVKAAMMRLERERDLARGDVKRLEEERNALRERLKIATETQVSEHIRYENMIVEYEERIRKLECERRDLMSSQGNQRASIHNAEEQLEDLKAVVSTTQCELSQQRILYAQLKTLHEQTDRSLSDSQSQLSQAESELGHSRERARDLERSRATLEREVAQLKNERTILKGNLAQVDQDKDALLIQIDEKTEKAAYLDQELKAKEAKMSAIYDQFTELQKKLDIILDENATKDQQVRNNEHELHTLRQEICSAQRLHENSLREIRRLSNDLASSTKDVQAAQCQLEQSRQEVENLKKQLQDYVAEVRRIEELLQQKEGERSELLDHFRSLSLEATALESNNNSLGHEAEEAKCHLQAAEHKVCDLQMQLESKENLIRNYENQIADLTAHVACLESQMEEQCAQKARLETDISAVRDLCVKLDSQKDELIEASAESDVIKMHLDNELTRLREDQDSLREQLSKERCTIESLEDVLAASRQETVEGRMANQELHAEVAKLHRRIDDLQQRLENETCEVRKYQIQAAEYSQQVAELRREVTNERFERARLNEETRRSSDSACVCCRTVVPRPTAMCHPEPGFSTYSRPNAQSLGILHGHSGSPVNATTARLSPNPYTQPYTQPYKPSINTYRKPTDYGTRRTSYLAPPNTEQTPAWGMQRRSPTGSTSNTPGYNSYIQSLPPPNAYGPGNGTRLECTFTAAGAPVTNATAQYTFKRGDGTTQTTRSALTNMSTGQDIRPSAPPSVSGVEREVSPTRSRQNSIEGALDSPSSTTTTSELVALPPVELPVQNDVD